MQAATEGYVYSWLFLTRTGHEMLYELYLVFVKIIFMVCNT